MPAARSAGSNGPASRAASKPSPARLGSRQFLYTVDELRREIERLRAAHLANDHTAVPVTQRASEASLKARNQMLLAENRRLKGEIAGLRDELAGAWGELRALHRTSSQTGPKGMLAT